MLISRYGVTKPFHERGKDVRLRDCSSTASGSPSHDYEHWRFDGRRVKVFRDDYEEVGVDFVSAEDPHTAAWKMVPRWNNGSGQESESLREANDARRATSFSSGDILIVIRSDCEEREMYISDGLSLAPINFV